MVDENNNYPNNEDDLDKIFDEAKNNKISKAVKKAKRLSTFKIVMISFFTFIIFTFITTSIGREIINKRWSEYENTIKYRYEVQAPNKFPGTFYTNKGYFSGETEHKTFKYINGKRVYTGTYGTKYNLFGEQYTSSGGSLANHTSMTWEEIDFLHRYNDVGQKLMMFYYPYVNYGDKYENDLSLLEDIGNDKYMEIALSFDKSYSIDEVNDMISKDINLTWYWVDVANYEQKENQKYHVDKQDVGGEIKEVIQYPDLCFEDYAYGIKTINEYGERYENPEKYFIDALTRGGITHIYDVVAGKDGKLTKDDIKVQGIVVTGDAENLKVLRNLPFIKASSLGVVTDKY